jgi:hypothetical protein
MRLLKYRVPDPALKDKNLPSRRTGIKMRQHKKKIPLLSLLTVRQTNGEIEKDKRTISKTE